jgi:hypothetical protein
LLPRAAWASFAVRPETLLGWHGGSSLAAGPMRP